MKSRMYLNTDKRGEIVWTTTNSIVNEATNLRVQIINFFNCIFNVAWLYCFLNSHTICNGCKVYICYLSIRKFKTKEEKYIQSTNNSTKRWERIRSVPDSFRNFSAASTYPSVTRKFITNLFMSSFRILTSVSFFSHSSLVITFFEIAFELLIKIYINDIAKNFIQSQINVTLVPKSIFLTNHTHKL